MTTLTHTDPHAETARDCLTELLRAWITTPPDRGGAAAIRPGTNEWALDARYELARRLAAVVMAAIKPSLPPLGAEPTTPAPAVMKSPSQLLVHLIALIDVGPQYVDWHKLRSDAAAALLELADSAHASANPEPEAEARKREPGSLRHGFEPAADDPRQCGVIENGRRCGWNHEGTDADEGSEEENKFRSADKSLPLHERIKAHFEEYAAMESGDPAYATDSSDWLDPAHELLRAAAEQLKPATEAI